MQTTDENFKEGMDNIDKMIALHTETIALLHKLKIGIQQQYDKKQKESNHGKTNNCSS